MAAGEWDSDGDGWGRGLLPGESEPLVCPCGRGEGAAVFDEDGGRPLSWRMMQFLSGPECSPSCDGALRLRSAAAAAAAASSRSFSICLLGRPTGFLGLPGPTWRTGGGGHLAAAPAKLPPLPEFSDWLVAGGLPGPRLEEDEDAEEDILREELMELPVRTLECSEEEEEEEQEEMVLADGLGD